VDEGGGGAGAWLNLMEDTRDDLYTTKATFNKRKTQRTVDGVEIEVEGYGEDEQDDSQEQEMSSEMPSSDDEDLEEYKAGAEFQWKPSEDDFGDSDEESKHRKRYLIGKHSFLELNDPGLATALDPHSKCSYARQNVHNMVVVFCISKNCISFEFS